MTAFSLKLVVAFGFTTLLWAGFTVYQHPMPWWVCAAVGVPVVFAAAWALDWRGQRRRRRWAR